jgi:hypothetical protein
MFEPWSIVCGLSGRGTKMALQRKWRLCVKPCTRPPALMMWEPPVGWSLAPLGKRTWLPELNRNTLGSLNMCAVLLHRSVLPAGA